VRCRSPFVCGAAGRLRSCGRRLAPHGNFVFQLEGSRSRIGGRRSHTDCVESVGMATAKKKSKAKAKATTKRKPSALSKAPAKTKRRASAKAKAKAKPQKAAVERKGKAAPKTKPRSRVKAAAKSTAPSASRAKKSPPRRDGTGKLDPKYARDLRALSRENNGDDDNRAFFKTPRSGDDLAEELGKEAVETMTSGEDQSEHLTDEQVDEERGGPFVKTGGEEFASGTDRSNPRDATREPFPRT
jgi:hypothetical protein